MHFVVFIKTVFIIRINIKDLTAISISISISISRPNTVVPADGWCSSENPLSR